MIIIFIIFFIISITFYPVTRFLVAPLLVTALLSSNTPITLFNAYLVKRHRKRQWHFAFTSQERNLS